MRYQFPTVIQVKIEMTGRPTRVCIYFTCLNKACPKDSFTLLSIDAMVEPAAGHEMLSYMNTYNSYNHISIHSSDLEKKSFITNQGTYCYKVMPFGLKNVGATYQHLVNKMFHKQIGDTMDVYIDDMQLKSKKTEQHMAHLQKAFGVLH